MTSILDRVTSYVTQRQLLSPQDSVVVGFSSGPDSVFLLVWLMSFLDSPTTQIRLVYCDHGLRPEAVLVERQMCISYATQYGLPLTIRRIPVRMASERTTCSHETAGRQWRYRMLTHVARLSGAKTVLTAHHGDDVVETFLAQLCRGARSGLVGIRPKVTIDSDNSTSLVRPLLAISKLNILGYLHDNGLVFCIDESNLDVTYRRNQIRHQVVPGLANLAPDYVDKIGGAVGYLQGVFDLVDELASTVLSHVSVDENGVVRLPRAVILGLPKVVMSQAVVVFLKQHMSLEATDKQLLEVQIVQIVRLIKQGRGSTSLPELHRIDVSSEWIALY